MALTNVEITIEDQNWPKMKLIIKEGTRVQTEIADRDVAATKFQATINNFVTRAISTMIDRRMNNGR